MPDEVDPAGYVAKTISAMVALEPPEILEAKRLLSEARVALGGAMLQDGGALRRRYLSDGRADGPWARWSTHLLTSVAHFWGPRFSEAERRSLLDVFFLGDGGDGGDGGGEGGEAGGGDGAAPQLTATCATAASPLQPPPRLYSKANDAE